MSGLNRIGQATAVGCENGAGLNVLALSKLIRRLKPSVLLTYGWGGTNAIAAGRLAGVPAIVHTEDGFLDDEAFAQKPRRRWARRILFKTTDALVVPSLTLRNIAVHTWHVPNERLKFIPNGIDIARFIPASSPEKARIRRHLRIPEHAVVVGIVGALRPEKNHARLLEAILRIARLQPPILLLIVGDGPLRNSLQETISKMNLQDNVRMTGNIIDPAMHYRAMDILACASDTEQMPLSVLEGMASGLPIVSTDVGDVRSMVPEANKPIVTDSTQFANALRRLVEDASLRVRLGWENRQHCLTQFDRTAMLGAYQDLYAEFCGVSRNHDNRSRREPMCTASGPR
jgi:glycosyltransferase involved in cell wall biosynthesis